MNYTDKLKRNIRLYYYSSIGRGLVFSIPVWVAYHRRFLDYSQISLMAAVALGLTIILELPTGALADLIGRGRSTALGFLISALSSIGVAFATNGAMLIAGYLAAGVGTALVSGAAQALVYDSLKETGREQDYMKVASKQNLVFQISIAFGALAGGYLYQVWIGLPYLLKGFAILSAMVCTLFYQEPKIDSEKFTFASYLQQTKAGFHELFKNSYVTKLSLFYMLVGGITWSCQIFFNQPLAADIGFTEIEQSWLFGLVRFINAVVIFQLIDVKGIVTKKRTFILLPILMMLAYLPGWWADKLVGVAVLALATFLSTARWVTLGPYTNEEFESKYRATAISALNMLVSLVYVILVAGSGWLMDAYTTKAVFSILGVLSLVFVLPLGLSLARTSQRG